MSRAQAHARAGESRLGRAGLPAWLRACVLLHSDFADPAVPAAQIAADLGGHVSERTVQRYRARYAARGTVARSQGACGPEPAIHGETEAFLRGVVAMQADLYLDELAQLLNAVYGPAHTFTRRQVDDALRRMRFVLVHKEWRNMNADPEEQRRWFTTPPVGPPRQRGILGVPTAAMVDIDETVVRIGGLRRTRARTLRGTRAVCPDVNDYAGVAYSIILATDINVGVVAYQILPATVNRDAFLLFLYFFALPEAGPIAAVPAHGQRVVAPRGADRGDVRGARTCRALPPRLLAAPGLDRAPEQRPEECSAPPLRRADARERRRRD
nr:hypothetical protein [Hydrogenophaga sp.]